MHYRMHATLNHNRHGLLDLVLISNIPRLLDVPVASQLGLGGLTARTGVRRLGRAGKILRRSAIAQPSISYRGVHCCQHESVVGVFG